MQKTAAFLIALSLFSSVAQARGVSSVELGATVAFRHYELVKMLDRHFTVEMEEDAKPAMNMGTDDKGHRIVIIQ